MRHCLLATILQKICGEGCIKDSEFHASCIFIISGVRGLSFASCEPKRTPYRACCTRVCYADETDA